MKLNAVATANTTNDAEYTVTLTADPADSKIPTHKSGDGAGSATAPWVGLGIHSDDVTAEADYSPNRTSVSMSETKPTPDSGKTVYGIKFSDTSCTEAYEGSTGQWYFDNYMTMNTTHYGTLYFGLNADGSANTGKYMTIAWSDTDTETEKVYVDLSGLTAASTADNAVTVEFKKDASAAVDAGVVTGSDGADYKDNVITAKGNALKFKVTSGTPSITTTTGLTLSDSADADGYYTLTIGSDYTVTSGTTITVTVAAAGNGG